MGSFQHLREKTVGSMNEIMAVSNSRFCIEEMPLYKNLNIYIDIHIHNK